MAIHIERLSVRYPHSDEWVVKDFSLHVRPGELVLLAGPTGCGKSTLLAVISGVIPHARLADVQGTVDVFGLDPQSVPLDRVGRVVGHLFQNVEAQLFTDRVEDEVLLPLEFGPEGAAADFQGLRRLASAALDAFDLGGLGSHAVDTLSSGLKQRLALASMYIHGSGGAKRVLLLDEPFSFLDPPSARRLAQTLARLKKEGLAIVVAEHREDVLAGVADRVVRMGGAAPIAPDFGGAVSCGAGVVECRDLCFSHGKRVILQNLDLEIRGRECVTLVGENGAGKTTLCEILAGLRPPSRGHVRVVGREVLTLRPETRIATVGLVVQNPDRQLFAPQVQGELPFEEGSRLLRSFGLWDHRDRHPRSLSYGQKRRLALARILVRNPGFLMVDEVSVGQDQSSLQVLLEELWSYVRGGGSLLVTSHDPRVVGRLPGRVVELAHGRLRDCPGQGCGIRGGK